MRGSGKGAEHALKDIPLFQALSRSEIKAVAKDFEERHYGSGEDIVVEGGKGGGFFVVTEGRVKIIQGGKAKGSQGPGFFFGEMTLLDGEPRSATIRAEGGVRVLSASSWNFLSLLEENWSLTKKILAHLSRRIRQAERSSISH